MKRVSCGLGAALLTLAGAQVAAAGENDGFNVNYEALLVIEDDAGAITSATGTGLSIMLTDCINWVYNDSIDLLLEGDGTNFQIVSDLAYSESIEGTHGSIVQSLSIVSSSADFPGGEISYSAQYERASDLGDGAAMILLEAGDASIDGALPINSGEYLPIQAYKELLAQLKDGEDRIEIPISALGSLESMEPRAGEGLMAVYEVVDSPFEDYDLPETYDDVFAGESWAVRAVLPPVEDSSDPEEVIFQIHESGAISFWLITFEGAQIALKPTFAGINPGAC